MGATEINEEEARILANTDIFTKSSAGCSGGYCVELVEVLRLGSLPSGQTLAFDSTTPLPGVLASPEDASQRSTRGTSRVQQTRLPCPAVAGSEQRVNFRGVEPQAGSPAIPGNRAQA